MSALSSRTLANQIGAAWTPRRTRSTGTCTPAAATRQLTTLAFNTN